MNEIPSIEVAQVPDPLPAGLTVLDVREPVEWQHGHIDGAVHIPLAQVPERRAELPVDQQVLVVCKVGGRSAQATAYLAHAGVQAVNLDGGMLEWAAAGRPMVAEGSGEPQVV